jgi:hypothetical protein
MKILILILMPFLAYSQAYTHKDTTFQGYISRISYLDGNTNPTNLFLIMHGAGEVSTTINYCQVYGPHYWFNNSWNGILSVNGSSRPVYVTLQQGTSAFTNPANFNQAVIDIINRFNVNAGGLVMMGLSRGANRWNNYITYKTTADDYVYANRVRVVVNLAGQLPDDTYGAADLGYPQKFGNAVKNSNIKYLGVEQYLDGRQVHVIVDNIQDSIGTGTGRTAFFWTNFGDGGHNSFNEMYNPSQKDWTLSNPDIQNSNGGLINTIPIATGQNLYEWAYRQLIDTTLTISGSGPQIVSSFKSLRAFVN